MTASFGSKTSKSKTTGEVDPWDVAIPDIESLLGRLRTSGADLGNVSETTSSAFDTLKTNAAGGNPYAADIDALTRDLFATPDRTGEVSGAFDTLNRRLSPTADGTNLNIEENPYVQRVLQNTTDDAVNRTSSMFAGAGRDLSGAHLGALGKSVVNAQAPVLMDQYTREQGRTDAAARDLFSAESGAATTMAGLDASRAGLRTGGIQTGQAAIDAANYGPERTIELEESLRTLPVDELARLAEILFAAGGLGQQTQGTGTQKQSGFSLGVSPTSIGQGFSGLGSLLR